MKQCLCFRVAAKDDEVNKNNLPGSMDCGAEAERQISNEQFEMLSTSESSDIMNKANPISSPGKPAHISPSKIFEDDLESFMILLRPHIHVNGVCERKHRVWSAPGRVREKETLEARITRREYSSTPTFAKKYSIIWYRSTISSDKLTVIENSVDHTQSKLHLEEASFVPIDDSKDMLTYTLSLEDVGCIITAAISRVNETMRFFAVNCAGPIEPAPPRAVNLRINGECLEGKRLRAEYTYCGGHEGATEVWWMRVRNGKREVVTEPRPIKGGGPFTNTTMMLNADPRNYSLTGADVGCVLKVKCKPIRSDGYDGEVATSKSTILIKPSETSVVTSENTAAL